MTLHMIHTLIFMIAAAITVAATSALGSYINRRLAKRTAHQPIAVGRQPVSNSSSSLMHHNSRLTHQKTFEK